MTELYYEYIKIVIRSSSVQNAMIDIRLEKRLYIYGFCKETAILYILRYCVVDLI